MTVTTRVFRLPAEKYFKILFLRFLRQKAVWIFAIIILSVIALWWNTDFFYVLLILIFLVFPFLLMMKYFEYATHPQNRWNILDKYIEMNDREIIFHFTDESRDCVLWSDIRFFKSRSEAYLLFTDKKHFIYIPKDAFESDDEYLRFCRQMLVKINS